MGHTFWFDSLPSLLFSKGLLWFVPFPLPFPTGFEAKPGVGLETPRNAWCGWDLGDPGPSQPSALPRTLSRARKMTVATVIAGQVKHIRTTVAYEAIRGAARASIAAMKNHRGYRTRPSTMSTANRGRTAT